MPKKAIQIVGVFDRIVWRSKDTPEGETPYVIGIVKTDDGPLGIKGNADPAEFIEGVRYRFQGYEEQHDKYGRQLKFHSWKAEAPHSRRGLTLYLQRNCEGIGAKRAGDLFDAFGSEAVSVLRTDPKKAHAALRGAVKLEVLKANAKKLQAGIKTEHARIELIDLLASRGFRQIAIDQCIARWGLNAADVIQKNPYQLMMYSIAGAGFLRCDRLYLDLGHDAVAITRQVFALQYVLKSDSSGNTWLRWRDALAQLNGMVDSAKVDGRQALAESIEMGLITERKEGGELWVAEARKAANENALAVAVSNLLAQGVVANAEESEASTTAPCAESSSTTTPTKVATTSLTLPAG